MRKAEVKDSRTRVKSKEAVLAELEKLGIKIPSGLYVSREHAQEMLDHAKGKSSKKPESDSEIDARLRERFESMDQLVNLTIAGKVRALIISGAPGLGKTYNVESALRKYDPAGTKHSIVRGYATGVGLFKQLWDHRSAGNILVLDDCDSVRDDEKGLNLLKISTDTSDIRRISYFSEGVLISDKDNSRIPNSFEFEGTLVFITNTDLDAQANSTHRFADHIGALMSRAHYVDLTLRTRRDALVRIKQVVAGGMLSHMPERDRKEVMTYVEEHMNSLRDLSLRTVIKIAALKQDLPNDWERVARVSCFAA